MLKHCAHMTCVALVSLRCRARTWIGVTIFSLTLSNALARCIWMCAIPRPTWFAAPSSEERVLCVRSPWSRTSTALYERQLQYTMPGQCQIWHQSFCQVTGCLKQPIGHVMRCILGRCLTLSHSFFPLFSSAIFTGCISCVYESMC